MVSSVIQALPGLDVLSAWVSFLEMGCEISTPTCLDHPHPCLDPHLPGKLLLDF